MKPDSGKEKVRKVSFESIFLKSDEDEELTGGSSGSGGPELPPKDRLSLEEKKSLSLTEEEKAILKRVLDDYDTLKSLSSTSIPDKILQNYLALEAGILAKKISLAEYDQLKSYLSRRGLEQYELLEKLRTVAVEDCQALRSQVEKTLDLVVDLHETLEVTVAEEDHLDANLKERGDLVRANKEEITRLAQEVKFLKESGLVICSEVIRDEAESVDEKESLLKGGASSSKTEPELKTSFLKSFNLGKETILQRSLVKKISRLEDDLDLLTKIRLKKAEEEVTRLNGRLSELEEKARVRIEFLQERERSLKKYRTIAYLTTGLGVFSVLQRIVSYFYSDRKDSKAIRIN